MSGGFTPGLRREDFTFSGGASFLASEHYSVKRGGITLAASLVSADSDGNKVLPAGQFVALSESGDTAGKYGPVDGSNAVAVTDTNSDTVGVLLEAVNLKDGDVICGEILHGSVIGARVKPSPLPADVRAAVKGRITVQ